MHCVERAVVRVGVLRTNKLAFHDNDKDVAKKDAAVVIQTKVHKLTRKKRKKQEKRSKKETGETVN